MKARSSKAFGELSPPIRETPLEVISPCGPASSILASSRFSVSSGLDIVKTGVRPAWRTSHLPLAIRSRPEDAGASSLPQKNRQREDDEHPHMDQHDPRAPVNPVQLHRLPGGQQGVQAAIAPVRRDQRPAPGTCSALSRGAITPDRMICGRMAIGIR